MVRWLAHAPIIREARVRFSPEAGREGFQWFSFPLQVNTGVVPLQIGHAFCLPPTHPSSSSHYSSITPLFASQSLTTSPFHGDYK